MAIDKDAVKQAVLDSYINDEIMKEMAKEEGVDVSDLILQTNRARMWSIFSTEVGSHIENYTVKQYGDFPDDQATNWDEAYLKQQMQKYINRMESNKRGDIERNRDLFKIAHYCQMIWSKRLGFDEAWKEVLADMKEVKVYDEEPRKEGDVWEKPCDNPCEGCCENCSSCEKESE